MAEMKVISSAFGANQTIPQVHTCEGADQSPPLRWEGAPAKTRTFAIICDDPDAPAGTWVHWVLFNLPAAVTQLSANVAKTESVAAWQGARQGCNDFKKIGYGGPCPPRGHGPHRYFFKVFALDAPLELAAGATKRQLEQAMEGHILARSELVGTYERR
jgi:Raf kinase inhibitor-like YbhB/YbcL family protein